MAFSTKNDEADRLARRIERHQESAKRVKAGTELAKLGKQLRKVPIVDARTADEILGYDENGLPA